MSVTLEWLNIGSFVTITGIDGLTLVPGAVNLLSGETIALILHDEEAAQKARAAIASYPTLVPTDSDEALAYKAAEAQKHLDALVEVDRLNEQARAWLASHDVPDYVIDYLRESMDGD